MKTLRNEGKSYRVIGSELKVPKSTVSDICKGYNILKSIQNRPRSGREKKTTPSRIGG